MNYRDIIDAETWAFIERTGAFFPPSEKPLTATERRQCYDAMCREFHAGRPAGVVAEDLPIAGVPCRRYRPDSSTAESAVTVVYAHGGGFVVGNLASHDDVCAEFCAHTGCDVVSVDYRLGPEDPHPAAYDDCCAVIDALAASGQKLVLAGDSAGACLVASVAHNTRQRLQFLGQLLIYPTLGGRSDTGSYVTHANAPMLNAQDMQYYHEARFGGQLPAAYDTAMGVLHDTDFSGLPPTYIMTAGCDPLRDDGMHYAAKIEAAGGDVEWDDAPGLVHGCLRGRTSSRAIAAAYDKILAALKGFTAAA